MARFPRVHKYLPAASTSLILGTVAGLLILAITSSDRQREFLEFSPEFFFLFLLPPIIFESGLSMDPGPFFQNIGAISLFAFGGTFLSAMVIGVSMYIFGWIGLFIKLPFVEAMMFGALISSTDPVTVLSLFDKLGVQVDMHALVFGESVLNDAVAVVLFRVFRGFVGQGRENLGLAIIKVREPHVQCVP